MDVVESHESSTPSPASSAASTADPAPASDMGVDGEFILLQLPKPITYSYRCYGVCIDSSSIFCNDVCVSHVEAADRKARGLRCLA